MSSPPDVCPWCRFRPGWHPACLHEAAAYAVEARTPRVGTMLDPEGFADRMADALRSVAWGFPGTEEGRISERGVLCLVARLCYERGLYDAGERKERESAPVRPTQGTLVTKPCIVVAECDCRTVARLGPERGSSRS